MRALSWGQPPGLPGLTPALEMPSPTPHCLLCLQSVLQSLSRPSSFPAYSPHHLISFLPPPFPLSFCPPLSFPPCLCLPSSSSLLCQPSLSSRLSLTSLPTQPHLPCHPLLSSSSSVCPSLCPHRIPMGPWWGMDPTLSPSLLVPKPLKPGSLGCQLRLLPSTGPELQRGCLLLALSGHPMGLDAPWGPVHSAHIPAPALPGFWGGGGFLPIFFFF